MTSQMGKERIAELLAPFLEYAGLSDEQLGAIEIHLDLLLKWNAKINLTAVRDPEQIVTRHFGESLFAARQLFHHSSSGGGAIDVGSGAGFPGLPIKLWAPGMRLTLVESNQRKATFLREVVRALRLSEVTILSDRAENLSAKAELVTFRAVEHFEKVLAMAERMIVPGGRLAVLIGGAQVQVAESVLAGVQWEKPKLIPHSGNRSLLIGHLRNLG